MTATFQLATASSGRGGGPQLATDRTLMAMHDTLREVRDNTRDLEQTQVTVLAQERQSSSDLARDFAWAMRTRA